MGILASGVLMAAVASIVVSLARLGPFAPRSFERRRFLLARDSG